MYFYLSWCTAAFDCRSHLYSGTCRWTETQNEYGFKYKNMVLLTRLWNVYTESSCVALRTGNCQFMINVNLPDWTKSQQFGIQFSAPNIKVKKIFPLYLVLRKHLKCSAHVPEQGKEIKYSLLQLKQKGPTGFLSLRKLGSANFLQQGLDIWQRELFVSFSCFLKLLTFLDFWKCYLLDCLCKLHST